MPLDASKANGSCDYQNWINDDEANHHFDVRRSAFTADIVSDEMARIFERCWLYVGHESELPNPNDFVSRSVIGRPVIFLRDNTSTIRVFLNACSHRGAEVCRQPKGNARLFVCPYHSWSFQNDGALRGMAFPDGASPSFDKSKRGLTPAPRLETYRGFVFISFNSDIVDLPTYLGKAKEPLDLILDQGEHGMEIVRGTHDYSVDANWKLLIENSIDSYHAPSTHNRYFSYLERNDGIPKADLKFSRGLDLGNGHAMMTADAFFPRALGLWAPIFGEYIKDKIDAAVERLTERFGPERAHAISKRSRNMLIFPNLIINDVQAITVRTFFPVRPNRMSVSSWALAPVHEDPDLRKLRLEAYLSFLGPGGFATPDDIELLESCQRGFANREAAWSDISRGMGHEVPDAMSEEQIRAFWRQWRRMMSEGPVAATERC